MSNKDTRTTSLTPFWCFCCSLWAYLTPFSSVSVVDFEQVNVATWRGFVAFKMLFYKKAENCSRSTIFFLVFFEQLQWLSPGFCAFTEKSTTRLLGNRFRSSRSQMVPQNMFSKNLAIFTGKHQCWSLFFRAATLWKGDFNTVVFLWILRNF